MATVTKAPRTKRATDIATKALPTGVVFAVGAAALFGASTPFAKLLLGGLLYWGSGVGLSLARRQSTAGAGEASLPRAVELAGGRGLLRRRA